jgi:hypothetical protein
MSKVAPEPLDCNSEIDTASMTTDAAQVKSKSNFNLKIACFNTDIKLINENRIMSSQQSHENEINEGILQPKNFHSNGIVFIGKKIDEKKTNGFVRLVAKKIGKSNNKGWGLFFNMNDPDFYSRIGLQIENGTTSGFFKNTVSYVHYLKEEGVYEDFKLGRQGANIVNKDSTVGRNIGTGYLLQPIQISAELNISNILEEMFTKDNLFLLTEFGEYIDKKRTLIEHDFFEIMKTKYLSKGILRAKEVSVFYKLSIEVKRSLQDKKNDDSVFSFMMMFCFACKKAELLLFDHSPAPITEIKGGAGELTTFTSKRLFKRYLTMVICIMAYLFFIWLLFDSARLWVSGITKILDARAAWMAENGQEVPADEGYLNYLYSFGAVAVQQVIGNISTILDGYKANAIQNAQSILSSVSQEATRAVTARCMDSLVMCVNGYFTGTLQAEVMTTGQALLQYQTQLAYLDAINTINTQFTQLQYSFNYSAIGIVCGINGLICCTILMGHIINPRRYTMVHLRNSIISLQMTYLGAGNIYTSLTTTAFQLRTLWNHDENEMLNLLEETDTEFRRIGNGDGPNDGHNDGNDDGNGDQPTGGKSRKHRIKKSIKKSKLVSQNKKTKRYMKRSKRKTFKKFF